MNTFKLIALDLDGTLLNEQKEISTENLKAIERAQRSGLTVIISTGRGIQNIKPLLQKYQLNVPVVAVNGSEVWKSESELWQRHLLAVDQVKFLHQIAVSYDTWWWTYAVEGAFNRANWVHSIENIQWLKFCFQTENPAQLSQIRQQLVKLDCYEITNSFYDNIEINPKGISKASGVREICHSMQISMDEVIAMGDSENDLSLIREAGLGVAMANAQPIVKQYADTITLSNNEHGVAHIIHTYVLNQK